MIFILLCKLLLNHHQILVYLDMEPYRFFLVSYFLLMVPQPLRRVSRADFRATEFFLLKNMCIIADAGDADDENLPAAPNMVLYIFCFFSRFTSGELLLKTS